MSLTLNRYRDFIVESTAEFTVARDQYVRPRTGWFSDRSASFLAAGRPVITQETGFSDFLPTGSGLFVFDDMDGVLAAIDAIESDPVAHSEAAREIARSTSPPIASCPRSCRRWRPDVATIVYSSYVIRYPVGGILSSNLQFLRGFARLGHEVVLVESNGWPDACSNPARRTLDDDPSAGIRSFSAALRAQDLPVRWAFVDLDGTTYGLDRAELNAVFARADLFIDRGLHRTFHEESAAVPLRVLVDPDPGYRQIQMELDVDRQ